MTGSHGLPPSPSTVARRTSAATALLSVTLLVMGSPGIGAEMTGPVVVPVERDQRDHERHFPPPPIAAVVGQLPHDWLTTFADIDDWQVAVEGIAQPRLRRSTYRPLFHKNHLELSWASVDSGVVTLVPPEPLQLPVSWNAIDFWVGGIPHTYQSADMYCTLTITTPAGEIRRLDASPRIFARRPVGPGLFHRLVREELRRDLQGGAVTAITIEIPKAQVQHSLHLYCLTFYTHQLQRSYQRPARLPFPTHPDGVVPTPDVAGAVTVEQVGGSVAQPPATRFTFTGADGSSLTYDYTPRTGSFDDIAVTVDGDAPFLPFAGGGVVFARTGGRLSPPYAGAGKELLGQTLDDGRLRTRWRLRSGGETFDYALDLRLLDRSLVVDVRVDGQEGLEVQKGYPNVDSPKKAIEVPMLAWEKGSRHYEPDEGMGREGWHARSPAVLLAGNYFLSAWFDWYVSDASMIYNLATSRNEEAGFDGGAVYLPVIDQGRNPIREKLIFTISREFPEVLPNIPNPPSPHGQLMRDRVYSHGISPEVSVTRHRNMGIRAVAAVASEAYHAASDRGGYRPHLDAGPMDSWIDDPGQGHGGLPTLIARNRELRSLGWLIGMYTDYCMSSPIFAHFAGIASIHDEEGYHRGAPANWPGTMVPVAGETLLHMRRQSKKIRAQLGLQLIYDDQRTTYPIWWFNDFTTGVPDAGKFRQVFEQTAQVYMGRRKIYNGPMLSEGGVHWMYSGLIDGNIARTQGIRIYEAEEDEERPRRTPYDLVDFQLRKIHLLTVDFCGNDYFEQWMQPTRDKFISETLAYGKLGMWNAYTPSNHETPASSARTYYTFHLAQRRYRTVPVAQIRYHDGGQLVTASEILKKNLEHLGRIYVRYENGFESWVNLNPEASWAIEIDGLAVLLPPYGWYQRRTEEWGQFLNYAVATAKGGRRYRIEDGRALLVSTEGKVERWDDVETDGTVLLLQERAGGYRLVNLDASHLRLDGRRLGLDGGAGAVIHSWHLEGAPHADSLVTSRDGWLDLSFLPPEHFALIFP